MTNLDKQATLRPLKIRHQCVKKCPCIQLPLFHIPIGHVGKFALIALGTIQ